MLKCLVTCVDRSLESDTEILEIGFNDRLIGWQLKIFSDLPPAKLAQGLMGRPARQTFSNVHGMSMALPRPSAHDALHLFRSANVVVGLSHGRCGVAGLRSGNYVILGCYGLPTNWFRNMLAGYAWMLSTWQPRHGSGQANVVFGCSVTHRRWLQTYGCLCFRGSAGQTLASLISICGSLTQNTNQKKTSKSSGFEIWSSCETAKH